MATSLDSEVSEIKADHISIQKEIEELKTLAQPLLEHSTKKVSLTRSDTMTDTVGPGSYNVSVEIGKAPVISLHRAPPRHTIPLAGRRIASQQSFAPAPNTYTPKVEFSRQTEPSFSFGHCDAKRLADLEEIATRSPGPIYSPRLSPSPGGKISTSKRDACGYFVRNSYPSPQDYQHLPSPRIKNGQFDRSAKGAYMKEYIPGLERLLRCRDGEFNVNLPLAPVRSCVTLKAQGHSGILDPNWRNPGVGTYSSALPTSERGKFSFPKASRNTRIL